MRTLHPNMTICVACNGNGLVSEMSPFGNETVSRCPDCGGYGYNKYLVKPVRHTEDNEIIAWTVTVPNRDFLKVEFSFDNALVWMDIHAINFYGMIEAA
jgi:excinuclease UvrABC ATPase subunit